MRKIARIALSSAFVVLMVSVADAEEAKKEGLVEKFRKKVIEIKTKAEAAKSKEPDKMKEAAKAEPARPKEAPKAEPAKTKEPAEAISPDEKKTAPVAKTIKDMSRGDMVSAVKGTLDSFDDILGLVPGLKAVKTEKGETSYTYEGVNIEELDDAKLKGLFSKVRQHATRINAERINRQLKVADQARKLSAAGTRIPTPPPIVKTPSAAIPPSTTAGPPRIPKIPPAPPRTTR